MPLKAIGNNCCGLVGDIGTPRTPPQIQSNIVRVDGQKSVYLPILKQGGRQQHHPIVNGIRDRSSICWTSRRTWWPTWSSISHST